MFPGFTYRDANISPPDGLFFNALPFKLPGKKIKANIYTLPKPGCFPLAVQELNGLAEKIRKKGGNADFLYLDFRRSANGNAVKLNLQKYPQLAVPYFNFKIRELLAPLIDFHFGRGYDGTQFWCRDRNTCNDSLSSYNKFSIAAIRGSSKKTLELLISYDGCSKILTDDISRLIREKEVESKLLKNAAWQNKIYSYDDMPEEAAYNLQEVYPVLNRSLAAYLRLEYPAEKSGNQYNRFYTLILSFYHKYLTGDSFCNLIPHEGRWKTADVCNYGRLRVSGRKLLFGKNASSYDPFLGLKENGPLKLPEGRRFHYFFIYCQQDSEHALLLYHYLIKKKGFIEVSQFTCINLQYDKEHDICIPEGRDPENYIHEQLGRCVFDTNITWYAFYISPYSSLEEDLTNKALYYRIKEMLLFRSITMQAVLSSELKSDFRHSVSNIGIAMIAKLGGTPWRLDFHANGTLVVGLGAFRLENGSPNKYAGSLVCFEEDGRFMEFDVFSDSDTKSIAHAAEEAFCQYRSKRKHTSEIVIHFYRNMHEKDLKPIEKMLSELRMDIPVVVAIISKCSRSSMLLFDNPEMNAMPVDGTWARIGPQTYLLNINARRRHSDHAVKQCFPLKIQLHSNNKDDLMQAERAEKILSQIYSFSFMHWCSVKQSPVPVTIKYPSLIASFLPWFQCNSLPEEVRNRPWFL